ncbi:MAG: MBL fold metallo-hydrolase [Candidatus Bathyarchaeia archaeon]
MRPDYRIVFLGTGGGRFVTMTQRRRTAGIRIIGEGLNLHLDPGPGALVHSIEEGFNPQRVNAVLVSHCHPDHYTDAEMLVEAMTRGMTRRRGLLAAPKSVLEGSDACEVSISKYHQQMVEQKIEVAPGLKFAFGGINILTTEARHTDPDAVGFRFETEFGVFAYTSDTEYFEGIAKYYQGVRLLALCVMRPSGKPWKGHMSTEDAIRIVDETRPEQAVLTHLGMSMLLRGPEKEARLIQEKTGVPAISAVDGMIVLFGESIKMETGKGQKDLTGFL